MRIISFARPTREGTPGFTLIELLLAVFLLLLLFGALVFNFSTLQPGTELTEGADQFESLLRFARAQAAYSGCRVQVQFEQDEVDPFAPNLYRLRLAWEPNPWENPGVYEDLQPSAWDVEGINQTIGVAQVSQPGAAMPAPRGADTTPASPPDPGAESAAPPASAEETEAAAESPDDTLDTKTAAPTPITFFPDGSSDSAQILLTARSAEDRRKVMVHLAGVTGSITHEWIAEAQSSAPEADDDWIEEFLAEMEAAEPLP